MYPSYIAKNINDLLDAAPADIQELLEGEEVGKTAVTLGKIYHVSIDSYVGLANIISFILIGALKPEDVTRALVDMVGVTQEDAFKIAEDLEKSILEKARVKILGKSPKDMVELTFQEGRTPDELRKEILDTTKRESAFAKEQTSPSLSSLPKEKLEESVVVVSEAPVPPVVAVAPLDTEPASVPVGVVQPLTEPSPPPVAATLADPAPLSPEEQSQPVVIPPQPSKKVTVAPGSRSQLLEQLQILGSIPNDDEVADRLSKIQEQISSIESKNPPALETKVPLQNFMFGEKGDNEVEAKMKLATYSKAPTKYNMDPYRETPDES